jgi:hypothetical protein
VLTLLLSQKSGEGDNVGVDFLLRDGVAVGSHVCGLRTICARVSLGIPFLLCFQVKVELGTMRVSLRLSSVKLSYLGAGVLGVTSCGVGGQKHQSREGEVCDRVFNRRENKQVGSRASINWNRITRHIYDSLP